jgi:nitroreductase
MLAARSLGVASIAQAALGAHPQFLRSYFGLPQDRLVVCGMSFGYEDTAHRVNRFRTSRAAVDRVVNWVDE